MSDGAGRVPYQARPDIDKWINDLMWEICIRSRLIEIENEDALRQELKLFSIQVIKASVNGCFNEFTEGK